MSPDNFRISVETLENGFEVEVPDFAEMKKKQAAADKAAKGKGSMDSCCSPYMGDCTKKYAAKSVADVLKLVKDALGAMPAGEYDAAFAEAAAKA